MLYAARPAFPPLLVFLAFVAIYLIWGTTYFVALIGLEILPSYLMTLRLLLAGALHLDLKLAQTYLYSPVSS